MKLSIIISVLNSHEILRRQFLHFKKMDLPDDVEIIIMDDGSDPPLTCSLEVEPKNLWIYPTHDKRAWTVALARNMAARISKAPYLLMTDIDHFWQRDAIMEAYNFNEDKMGFVREFAVLDENGDFNQDMNELRRWGLTEDRIKERGVRCSPHGNSFCMRKELYWAIGGYREDRIGKQYPQLEESCFKRDFARWVEAGKAKGSERRPKIYQFPNGRFCGDADYNPFGFFHTLSRKNLDPRKDREARR